MKVTLDISGLITGTIEGALAYTVTVKDDAGNAVALEAPYERLEEFFMLALDGVRQARDRKMDLHFDLGHNQEDEASSATTLSRE